MVPAIDNVRPGAYGFPRGMENCVPPADRRTLGAQSLPNGPVGNQQWFLPPVWDAISPQKLVPEDQFTGRAARYMVPEIDNVRPAVYGFPRCMKNWVP